MPPPSFRRCPHCGGEFGSASLSIHEKRCKAKPKHQPPPLRACDPPAAPAHPPPTEFEEETPLLPCRHCSRTFLPERLAAHEHACGLSMKRAQARQARRVTAHAGVRRATLAPAAAALRPCKWREQHLELQKMVALHRGPATETSSRRRPPRTPRLRAHEPVGCAPPSQRATAPARAAGGLGEPAALKPAALSAGGGVSGDCIDLIRRGAAGVAAASVAAAVAGGGRDDGARPGLHPIRPRRATAAERHAREWQCREDAARTEPLAASRRLVDAAADGLSRPRKPPPPWETTRPPPQPPPYQSRAIAMGGSQRSSHAYGCFDHAGEARESSVHPSARERRAGRPAGRVS